MRVREQDLPSKLLGDGMGIFHKATDAGSYCWVQRGQESEASCSTCSCLQLSSGLKVLKGNLTSSGLHVQPGRAKEPINSEKYF